MPSYEDFGDNIDAHLMYALASPIDETRAILHRRLQDGSWREAPGAWIHTLSAAAHSRREGEAAQVIDLAHDFVSELVRLKVGREAHETLPTLLGPKPWLAPADLDVLVGWLCRAAGPAETSHIADALERVPVRVPYDASEHNSYRLALKPLAAWLIRNGAAELRAKRRCALLVDFALASYLSDADPALRFVCLRYLVANAAGAPWRLLITDTEALKLLLRVFENAGVREPSSTLAFSLFCASQDADGAYVIARVLDPPVDWPSCPHLRRAALRALFEGELKGTIQTGSGTCWDAALASPYPGDDVVRFRSGKALDEALWALRHARVNGRPQWKPSAPATEEDERAWARALSRECIRIRGLHDVANHPDLNAPRLDRCVGAAGEASDAGIRDAVEEALEAADAPDAPSLALTIFRDRPGCAHVLRAALKALATRPVSVGGGAVDESPAILDEIALRLRDVLREDWEHPIAGVDVPGLLGAVASVELAALDNEDKVIITSDRLRVDRRALLGALDPSLPIDEQLAQGVTYVVHELIHVQQGISEKARVGDLRAVGAESTLLHVDLAADHATARIVSRAVPRWSLLWLKDLQGRSLARFPASPFNSAASRARKAQRLVGLRLDYLLRNLHPTLVTRLRGGYAFADFGPVKGRFLVLASGPPMALLGSGIIDDAEAKTLDGAVGEETAEARAGVDAIVQRLLRDLE